MRINQITPFTLILAKGPSLLIISEFIVSFLIKLDKSLAYGKNEVRDRIHTHIVTVTFHYVYIAVHNNMMLVHPIPIDYTT